jgi:hypothetical protein
MTGSRFRIANPVPSHVRPSVTRFAEPCLLDSRVKTIERSFGPLVA